MSVRARPPLPGEACAFFFTRLQLITLLLELKMGKFFSREAFMAMQELAKKYGHTWGHTPLDAIEGELTVEKVADATRVSYASKPQNVAIGILAPTLAEGLWAPGALEHTTYGGGTAWSVEEYDDALRLRSDIYRLFEDKRILVLRLAVSAGTGLIPYVSSQVEIAENCDFYPRHVLTCVNNMHVLLTGAFRKRQAYDGGRKAIADLMEHIYQCLMSHPQRVDEARAVLDKHAVAEQEAQEAEQKARALRHKADKLRRKADSLLQMPESITVRI